MLIVSMTYCPYKLRYNSDYHLHQTMLILLHLLHFSSRFCSLPLFLSLSSSPLLPHPYCLPFTLMLVVQFIISHRKTIKIHGLLYSYSTYILLYTSVELQYYVSLTMCYERFYKLKVYTVLRLMAYTPTEKTCEVIITKNYRFCTFYSILYSVQR